MRNLIGYLKKTLLLFSSLFLFALNTLPIYSQEQSFDIKTDIYHSWKEDTLTTSIYYTIFSSQTSRVISYYTSTILEENIKPSILLMNKNQKLEPTIHNRSGATDVVIDLKNTPISKETPITLKLTYQQKISKDKISLLSSVKDTRTTKMVLTYPKENGEVSWSSTPITKIESKGNNYEISVEKPQGERTTITLGEDMIYEFHINRNLINTDDKMYTSEIVIPANTTFQKVLIESFEPQPNRSYKDINGNYIIQYELAGNSNLTVEVSGYIKMEKGLEIESKDYSSELREFWKLTNQEETKRINKYLNANGLQVDDEFSSINELEDSSEKQLFYKLIYQYVIERLQPNTLTLGSLTGGVRLGGTKALEALSDATPEDYCDSLIAIYREYAVPTRFVLGYITNISDYNPDGMYHNWIEYYDITKNDWYLADPYLEDYSSTSLWNRSLPDHVSIIYRYENPNTPKLTYYSENDLTIKKTDQQVDYKYNFDISISFKPYNLTDSHLQGSLIVKNTGNTILDTFNIVKSNPDFNKYLDYIENSSYTILLPNDTSNIKFNIPSQEVETNIFAVVTAYSGTDQTEEKYLNTQFDIVDQHQYIPILSKLISALMYIIISIPIYITLTKLQKRNG